MIEIAYKFVLNFWSFLNKMAVYIIIGLLIAGILKYFLPDDFIRKHLGNPNSTSVIKSVLFGIPLPICSCSVIPIGVSLKKSGASSASVLSFLIATPVTGIDSILVTYGVFGGIFTAFRVISSVFISLFAGILGNALIKENVDVKEKRRVRKRAKKKDIKTAIKEILSYSFNELLSPLAKPLLYGIILGAIISLIPIDISAYIDNLFLQYILVLLVSVPIYVCSISSIPIALSLLSIGFSPGSALIFLTAGPATNIVTITTIYKIFGKRALAIYLSSIILGSFLFAFLFDYFVGEIGVKTTIEAAHHLHISEIFAVILLILIIYHIIIQYNIK
ncbi:permease [Methanocaldococcus fervens]|uniref:Permease n=1 Tax=Methanocaldococcus fervens (strain DSM 4213 / JCM 15782 / AG86) TaxID=573064 RepID=C7P8E2_METFA|nr:permease [Methanocaldococcus fervens]ACV24824.1 permease [Methanocaldococcus fervens AG86]